MDIKLNALNLRLRELELSLGTRLSSDTPLDNVFRRIMYSDVELLRLDVEEWKQQQQEQSKDSSFVNEVEDAFVRIDKLSMKLNLVPITRRASSTILLTSIELFLRILGVSSTFVIIGGFLSLPLLVLRALDMYFEVDPFCYSSEFLKRCFAYTFLFQSGLVCITEGLENNDMFRTSCALMCFSHASNIDGFLVAGTCPIRQIALAKKELFAIPFFSWMSLAIGGMPVDRSSRERAIKALKRSTEAARKNKICIAVAPEGTRSLTGQLLPFKKGPFYIWEEMRSPIVPFLIFGAYDLYPVGHWVNQTGVIVVRYLPAITPTEATSRDDMMRLVRRRMLESLKDCPPQMATDITALHYWLSMLSNVAMLVVCIKLLSAIFSILTIQFGFTSVEVLLYTSGWACTVTATLYIYYVYVVN